MASRPQFEPPIKPEMLGRLSDDNSETCLSLADTDMYTFQGDSGRWFPRPRSKCWLPGIVINKRVPDINNKLFAVTIVGRHLECSLPLFEVSMRWKKKPGCEFVGAYRTCDWGEVVQSDGMTTCKATCECDGEDCNHVTINIFEIRPEWQVCEIYVESNPPVTIIPDNNLQPPF